MEVGTIGWTDLTVDDADSIRDFYSRVAGWKPLPVAMGTYHDYNMTAPGTGEPRAGICHKRGVNAGLPSQWLIYVTVADLNASIARCKELGGDVVSGPRNMGGMGRFCVIRDPAGAVAGLFEQAR
jgi:predicted enzyme related to lactoylglutathione lyase